MLKTSMTVLILLILLMSNSELPPYVANTLAFFAGLSLKTIPDLIKGIITPKDTLIRLFKIAGLITIGWLIWGDKKIEVNIFYYIFGVTLFYEVIILLVIKHGKKWLESKAKNIDNE